VNLLLLIFCGSSKDLASALESLFTADLSEFFSAIYSSKYSILLSGIG
jgi:hypothetical protein